VRRLKPLGVLGLDAWSTTFHKPSQPSSL